MTALDTELLVNPKAVQVARSTLPSPGSIQSVGDYFRMLGDPTRLRILYSLARAELCVGDIVAVVGRTANPVSHHHAQLKAEHHVTPPRVGKVVFYSLADDHVQSVLRSIQEHVSEER